MSPFPSGSAAKGPAESNERGSAECVAEALETVLRARAPGVWASTPMVRQLAARAGRELDLDAQIRTLLDVAVRAIGRSRSRPSAPSKRLASGAVHADDFAPALDEVG